MSTFCSYVFLACSIKNYRTKHTNKHLFEGLQKLSNKRQKIANISVHFAFYAVFGMGTRVKYTMGYKCSYFIDCISIVVQLPCSGLFSWLGWLFLAVSCVILFAICEPLQWLARRHLWRGYRTVPHPPKRHHTPQRIRRLTTRRSK